MRSSPRWDAVADPDRRRPRGACAHHMRLRPHPTRVMRGQRLSPSTEGGEGERTCVVGLRTRVRRCSWRTFSSSLRTRSWCRASTPGWAWRPSTVTASASAGTAPRRRRGPTTAPSRRGTTATCESSRPTPQPVGSSRTSGPRPARRSSRRTATRSATVAGSGCTTGPSRTSRL